MRTVRIAWGDGAGPTAMAAYDAALATANAHDVNLVRVSSVLPAEADLAVVGTLPDLGETGDRLTVVESLVDRPPGSTTPGVAGLGWVRSVEGPGVLYEATGTDPAGVREEIRAGLKHGADLRDWDVADSDVVLREIEAAPDVHTSAVILAAYGSGEPIV